MNCSVCGLKLQKEEIKWLDDEPACEDCYEHETQEELA